MNAIRIFRIMVQDILHSNTFRNSLLFYYRPIHWKNLSRQTTIRLFWAIYEKDPSFHRYHKTASSLLTFKAILFFPLVACGCHHKHPGCSLEAYLSSDPATESQFILMFTEHDSTVSVY